MSILQWGLFRHSFLKQLKYYFSAPKQSQPVLMINETGYLSIEMFPLSTGYCYDEENKLAWEVEHNIKETLEGQDEPVLIVCERSSLPLDPYGRRVLKSDKKEKGYALATVKYLEAFGRIPEEFKKSTNAQMAKAAMYLCSIMAIIVILFVFIRR